MVFISAQLKVISLCPQLLCLGSCTGEFLHGFTGSYSLVHSMDSLVITPWVHWFLLHGLTGYYSLPGFTGSYSMDSLVITPCSYSMDSLVITPCSLVDSLVITPWVLTPFTGYYSLGSLVITPWVHWLSLPGSTGYHSLGPLVITPWVHWLCLPVISLCSSGTISLSCLRMTDTSHTCPTWRRRWLSGLRW